VGTRAEAKPGLGSNEGGRTYGRAEGVRGQLCTVHDVRAGMRRWWTERGNGREEKGDEGGNGREDGVEGRGIERGGEERVVEGPRVSERPLGESGMANAGFRARTYGIGFSV
jgi:hypothetical protein